MKHTLHTPGPWIVCVQDDGLERANTIFAESQLENGIIDSSEWDYCIAEAGIGHENYEANALLIAAAPDLLEALRGALEHWPVPSSICKDRPAWKAARAAIAKATGGAA